MSGVGSRKGFICGRLFRMVERNIVAESNRISQNLRSEFKMLLQLEQD